MLLECKGAVASFAFLLFKVEKRTMNSLCFLLLQALLLAPILKTNAVR